MERDETILPHLLEWREGLMLDIKIGQQARRTLPGLEKLIDSMQGSHNGHVGSITCAQCHKEFKPRGMAVHLSRVHGIPPARRARKAPAKKRTAKAPARRKQQARRR
jgi:hypothetical protein